MNNTNSKKYWNEYVTYWETKVSEANDEEKSGDKTNSDGVLEFFLDKLNVGKAEKLLDYGCGSCRLFPIYEQEVNNGGYFGIDIARVCLQHAELKWKELKIGANLFEFDGITIPFEESSFDKVICFGVFDACNQENTISEIIRVLKLDGVCLLTGKNHKYYEDDQEASIAEVNARKKGHPNYFTDVSKLIRELKNTGMEVLDTYYFARRGDFPKLIYSKTESDNFYEWALLLKKKKMCSKIEFEKFSNPYSKTFLDRQTK